MGKLSVKEFIDTIEKDRFMKVDNYNVFVSNIDERFLLVSNFDDEHRDLGIIDLDKRKYYALSFLLPFNRDEFTFWSNYKVEIAESIADGIAIKAKKAFPEGYNNITHYKHWIFKSLVEGMLYDKPKDRFNRDPFHNINDVVNAIKDKDHFIESSIDRYLDLGYQLIAAQKAFEEYKTNPPVELRNRMTLYNACEGRKTIKITFNYNGNQIICRSLSESIQRICADGNGWLEFLNSKDNPFLKMGFNRDNEPSINFDDIKFATYGHNTIYVPEVDNIEVH